MNNHSRRSFLKNIRAAAILSTVPVGDVALRTSRPVTSMTAAQAADCTCHLGKKRLIDPETGRFVWQMTNGHCNSWVAYMYVQSFSRGERYLLFNSDRTGLRQLYRMDIDSGEARQLSFFEGYSGRPVMDAAGDEVYFVAGGPRVWSVNIASGLTRQVGDFSGLTQRLSGLTRTGAGDRLLVTYLRKTDDVPGMAVIDAAGGSPEEIMVFTPHPRRGPIERLSHPQINPSHPHLVSVVLHPDMQGGYPFGLDSMDLPDEMRARACLVDLDRGEWKPFLVMPPGFRATHEYWSPDGRRLYFHRKGTHGWGTASIGSIPLEGQPPNYYIQTESVKLGHSAVNPDQTRIVSDSQEPRRNELLLISIPSGEYEVLCWPNTSGEAGMSHTHPSFSRSGRYVIYTSDISGFAQVYMVDLQEKAGQNASN